MVTVALDAANRLQPASAWCLGRLFLFLVLFGGSSLVLLDLMFILIYLFGCARS